MNAKIIGKVGFRYIENIERANKSAIEKALCFEGPNLSDGLLKFYTMDSGIKQMFPSVKMAGTAVTVKVRAGDNLMLHKALSIVQPGDVLVVETQDCSNYSVAGDLMISCMQKLGIAGLVVDGTVRDIDEIKEIGVPVFARGVVCAVGDKEGPGEINFPISCGGVVVHPGDIVFGDANGVVVIPKDDVEEVFKAADKKVSYEVKRREEIENNQLIKDELNDILRAKGVV